MSTEERVVSDLVWTPERGSEQPEVRGISWENFLLSDDKYLGKWKTDSGIRITPETALQSTIVLACCRILAETVSGLPLHVYRRSPDGGDEIAKEIPLYKVLTFRPNDWQTKQEFFEQIVMTLALWGNSYTRIRSGQYGSVSHLDNLHPSRMEVERLENGRLRYSYTDPETGRLERYNQDQIMHCRWTPEQDGIKGMVPVEIAREAIGLARACEQHAARFWANSARPGVVLQTDGTLNAEAAERLRDNWERLHRGSERAFRTAVLTGGMKAVELGMTNESSQFVASRDFQTAEICRVYRIPQHLIQGTPGGDLEVQGQEFVTYTLMPWLHRIESSISRSLIYNDDEYYAKFDVRGLLRANSQQRASYYSTMTSLGIMTINDCRRAEGLKPLGDLGDHHFVAMNMQTLEDATKPKPEGGMPGMPGGGGGGGDGPPPPAPGGPPSLPEVKTGKAPIESPKGEASKPKEEEAVEEASADWEDAIEGRAFCATGEGQGTDNSCSSSGGTGAAKVDNSWKKAEGEYSFIPGKGKSPLIGGDEIQFLTINAPKEVSDTMKDMRVKSLTDVVAIGGGLTRGSLTKVIATDGQIQVLSDVPVDPDDKDSDSMTSSVTLGVDEDGKKFVDYDTMAANDGTANLSGESAARMSSILLEKFPESIAAAEKAGFSYATTFAMGNSEDEFKGYRLWPQFGFDAEIYRNIRKDIPKDIISHDDPVTIQELIATPAGKKWWNENGRSMEMKLDLKDKKSDGYKQYKKMAELSKRLKKRNEGRSLFEVLFPEYRAFCSTGPGGGIDNSCGAKTMAGLDKDSSGGAVAAGDPSLANYKSFVSIGDTKNSSFATPPTEEEVKSALNVTQREKFGAQRTLNEGHPIDLRIDINAFKNHKVYAVTAHEHEGGSGVGKPIGYDTLIRLKGPVSFVSNENSAEAIGKGRSKGTHSTVKGNFDPSREIPEDIDSWTPVGYDPYKAVYYYDKRTGEEVIAGTDSVSIGNTVFTKSPRYGNAKEPSKPPRNAHRDYRSIDERAFCPTGEGNGIDNSCGSGGAATIDYDKLIDRIASSPDGFTLDVRNVEQPEDGIMVSEFQNDSVRSMRINAATIRTASSAIKVREFINNNSDLLLGRSDRFLGGWLDGDDFYFDVATRFEPKDAEKALETGRKSGQLAVFNLATFNTTYVHYESGDSRKPKDWDERFERAKSDLGDQGQELEKHGKKTVRSIAFSESHDYSCLDKETTSEQQHSESRHSGEGVEASSVSSVSSMGGEGSVGSGGDSRSGVVQGQSGGGSGTVRGQVESRGGIGDDCGRGPGGIFGPGNKCQDEGSPSSTMGGGGSGASWKKLDTPSEYDAERLKVDPPSRSLAEVNSVTIFNGRTLSASLKEVGVTLDQASTVCGNLSPESNVVVAHGTLKDITTWIDDPSRATDPESSVTVVSKQPFGGVEDAIGTAATLSRTDDDELLLSYVMFSVAPEAQRDNPIAVARSLYSGVVKSINEAEKIGVEEVGMLAAGSDSNDEYKGYRIWPRLGFDGIIPRSRITPTYSVRLGFFEKYGSNLPDTILSDRAKQEKSEGALTIQSLYDTKEGQRWWEENGGAMPMFLRVGDNDDSGWQRFKRISGKVSDRDIIDVIDIEWRSIRGEAEERGFCPTGEGNGIDNSCGSGGGAKMAPDKDGGGGSVAGPSVGAGKPASVTVESQDSLDKAASVLGLGGIDDVVKISGGNVRGAKVDVYADPSGFTKVSALWPIDREDPDGGGKVFTEVSMANTPEGKVLGFEAFGPSGGSISSGADQQKVMSIVSEKVAESIESAEENGFVAVTTFAVGDSENQYKGYRLWPQFGFDADLPRDLAKRVPPEIVLKAKGIAIPPPGSTSIPHHLVVKSLASQHRDLTIQELISTREGDRWWDKNGDDISLKLDLTDKSSLGYKKWQGMKDRLPRLRERNETRSFFDAFVEERGFCPTGEGGGILNTCGNDDGWPTDAFGGDVGGFERSPSATKEKKGGGGDSAPAEPLVWRAGEPHPDLFAEAVSSNVVTRSADGKIESTTIPGAVISPGFAGQPEIDPVTVGRYLAEKQSEHRGRAIDTATEGKPLEGDDFEYMVTGIVSQIQSATARGVAPNFYSPEDRQKQLDEYAKIQPLMRGGRTASGRCIGEEGPNGECEPGEGISPHAEFLFRAAQALTSPMATPKNNMLLADQVITRYFTDPDPSTATLGNGLSMPGLGGKETAKKFARLQGIIDTIGMEETRKLFSQPPMTVRDFQKHFESKIPGADKEKFTADYYADEVAPLFSIFGPKVGPFFANNMGDHDPLTADLWFSRTWGRLSGELIKERSPDTAKKHATVLMESTKDINRKEFSALGIDGRQFRTIVSGMKKSGVIPSTVIDWAELRVKQYAKDGHPDPKKGTGTEARYKLDRLATAILNNETKALEAPQNNTMRHNMIKVMKEASARAKMPVAYMQDVLWQDEQDAWGTLGTRTSTEPGVPSLYSDVIKQIASGQIKRREARSYVEQDGDLELRYLSDQPGGIEQALFDVMLSDMEDDDFVELAVSLLRRNATNSASTLESAKNTVADMRAVGLSTVEMPKAGLDGLHVMGFDAEIPSDLVEMLPESLSHAKTLLDLHVSSEGQEWWKENGRDIDVSIDLDGVQGQIFDSFIAGKRWEDIIEEGTLDDYGNS